MGVMGDHRGVGRDRSRSRVRGNGSAGLEDDKVVHADNFAGLGNGSAGLEDDKVHADNFAGLDKVYADNFAGLVDDKVYASAAMAPPLLMEVLFEDNFEDSFEWILDGQCRHDLHLTLSVNEHCHAMSSKTVDFEFFMEEPTFKAVLEQARRCIMDESILALWSLEVWSEPENFQDRKDECDDYAIALGPRSACLFVVKHVAKRLIAEGGFRITQPSWFVRGHDEDDDDWCDDTVDTSQFPHWVILRKPSCYKREPFNPVDELETCALLQCGAEVHLPGHGGPPGDDGGAEESCGGDGGHEMEIREMDCDRCGSTFYSTPIGDRCEACARAGYAPARGMGAAVTLG